jgi:hypothetical protein
MLNSMLGKCRKQPLVTKESLQQQGMKHGTMVFCRLEGLNEENEEPEKRQETKPNPLLNHPRHREESTTPPTTSNQDVIDLASSPESKKKQCNGVIDLVDSDDDDDDDDLSVNLLASDGEDSSSKKPKAAARNIKGDRDEDERSSKKRTASTTKTKRPASSKADSPTRSAASKKKQKGAIMQPASKAASASKAPDTNFQIASYNVWFGPPDPTANQVFPQQRMKAIAEALQESCGDNLSFLGFQELTTSLRQHLGPHLETMGYSLCTQPLGDFYGVGLGIPKDIEIVESKFIPFRDSTQGRGLLFVQTPTLLFGTTHLESFVNAQSYNGAKQRESQIVQAAEFCEARLKSYPNLQIAMIAGDLNWDDERKRGEGPNKELLSLVSDDWKDAGKPFDYTYDAKENPMLAGNLRRRFDRCIYLAKNCGDYQVSLQKVGKSAIPNLSWNKKNPYNGTSRQVPVAPSDHFGIAVKFQKKK